MNSVMVLGGFEAFWRFPGTLRTENIQKRHKRNLGMIVINIMKS